jgi:hypothetical protein
LFGAGAFPKEVLRDERFGFKLEWQRPILLSERNQTTTWGSSQATNEPAVVENDGTFLQNSSEICSHFRERKPVSAEQI